MKISYLLALILMLFSGIAYSDSAQCTYNGNSYAEGSIIGPLTCVDGKWIKK